MILLKVLSHNGAPLEGLSAQFDELGGTIGRADTNQLVLPDPERMISRVHARIVYRGGAYAVVDCGSNPVAVNGAPVGSGLECLLKLGDRLEIGGYLVAVNAAAQAGGQGGASGSAADPFADLFPDAMGLATPGPVPPTVHTPSPRRTVPALPTPAAAASAQRAAALSPGHIPEDWDPFAPDGSHAAASPVANSADAFANLPRGSDDSLDALFGLGAASPMADPLGAPPAQAYGAKPNMAAHADALESLFRTATLMPASVADHGSELNTPMSLPPRAAPRPAVQPSAQPRGAVFSWDDPPSDGRVVTLPGVHGGEGVPTAPLRPARPPTQQALAQPPQRAIKPSTPDPLRAPLPAASAAAAGPRSVPLPPPFPASFPASSPAPSSGSASPDQLLAALLAGLGAPGLRLTELTPQSAHLLGTLLRESVGGAVALLVARAELKREMRAEVTMIVSRENNPLKFSPSVDVALQHLLGPPTPGFMAPADALRDAFNDLRAHQLGVMAGMRAALDGVLQRFDPQQLEAKLVHRSAISNLIPGARRARLWESFQELFAQLQTEAQDDFDELFGKAFLRAYEDQLDRLSGEPGPR